MLTVPALSFADIHYYFGTPTVRPLLHRFDKASYFYVYHNSTRQTARIEVANNPGTQEQDAFNGYLDSCRVINSHRFPTLVTLVVDGAGSAGSSPSSRSVRDPEEWRLASADPRDPGKQKYRIHTLDIYFWAEEDAKLVTNTCKRLLSPSQLDVAELEQEPTEEMHEDPMNTVVQNLENVAVSDPAYQNGQTRDSRNRGQQQQPVVNVSPPPPSQLQQPQPYHPTTSISPVSAMSSSEGKSRPPEAPQAFAPIPYNPAAPAAPEPIAHREDTPPPPDDGTGTGLTAAATHDTGYCRAPSQPWTGLPQPDQYGHYGSPPPPQMFGSPPPPPSVPPSFGGSPSAVGSGHSGTHPSIAAQHYVPSPPPPSQAHSHDPVETPGAQFYPHNGQPHKPLQHIQPQYPDYLSAGSHGTPPPGGYGQFNYAQPQQSQQGSGYDVHSQVYRPTEQEAQAHSHHHKPSRTDTAGPARRESRADKVEKGLGKLWKRADKKFGIS